MNDNDMKFGSGPFMLLKKSLSSPTKVMYHLLDIYFNK